MTAAAWVLGSSSPRRTALRRDLGVPHVVDAPDVDEARLPGEPPDRLTERLARLKAETVAALRPSAVVLGADNLVAVGDRILGKPESVVAHRDMLRLLSGRAHRAHTGVAGGATRSTTGSTEVRFRKLGEGEIARYAASGEGRDKAGGYGLQGQGGTLGAAIRGSFTGVVGLPPELVLRLAADGGIPVPGAPA